MKRSVLSFCLTQRLKSLTRDTEYYKRHLSTVAKEWERESHDSTNVIGSSVVRLIGTPLTIQIGTTPRVSHPCVLMELLTTSFNSDNVSLDIPRPEKDVHQVLIYDPTAVHLFMKHVRLNQSVLWVSGMLNRHPYVSSKGDRLQSP
eukprot:PhF_6_TR37659/c0_g1_i1/m.56040